MNIHLGRDLAQHLVLSPTKQIVVDESISDCLSSQPSSFPFCQMRRWLPCFKKAHNIFKVLFTLQLGLLELESSNCDLLQTLTCQGIRLLITSPPHIVYLMVLDLPE